MANKGTHRGGKSFQDRQLSAKVRSKGLEELLLVLNDSPKVEKWSEFKKQTLQRLAPSLVPRINEHTGADGKELPVPIFQIG